MEKFNWQKQIPLSAYTTFKIGGPAKKFGIIKSEKDLRSAFLAIKEEKEDYFILGGGSNLLVSDNGFDGAVFKIEYSELSRNENEITAGAGLKLNELINFCLKNQLSGLEWAIGIPGTIGGAVYGNAGAMGSDISQSIKSVEFFSFRNDDLILEKFNYDECQFGYRESYFKKSSKKEIIWRAVFNLNFADSKISREKIKEYLAYRQNRQPKYPSAGSIFKNILISEYPHLLEIEGAPIKEGKLGAGYLIEACGLKGYRIGQAQIAPEHANFIVNLGGARAVNVLGLIKICQEEVLKKFKVKLEPEIRFLGF